MTEHEMLYADFVYGLAWKVHVLGWHESALAHLPQLCDTSYELMDEYLDLIGANL